MDDEHIVDLFYTRAEQAVTELSAKYGAICSRIAKNILNNALDAEECVNDAYLAAWNTIPPSRPHPLLAYVCRIVRNLSIMKYHRNTAAKRNSVYDAALEELEACIPSGTSVEDELSAKELTCLIDRFLETLKREDRILFVRRYWYSDPIGEIAARTNLSENNVSVRLWRIREKLRQYLKKEGYEI